MVYHIDIIIASKANHFNIHVFLRREKTVYKSKSHGSVFFAVFTNGYKKRAAASCAAALILITNKTIDKKSSHNPYTQDYARFFV